MRLLTWDSGSSWVSVAFGLLVGLHSRRVLWHFPFKKLAWHTRVLTRCSRALQKIKSMIGLSFLLSVFCRAVFDFLVNVPSFLSLDFFPDLFLARGKSHKDLMLKSCQSKLLSSRCIFLSNGGRTDHKKMTIFGTKKAVFCHSSPWPSLPSLWKPLDMPGHVRGGSEKRGDIGGICARGRRPVLSVESRYSIQGVGRCPGYVERWRG